MSELIRMQVLLEKKQREELDAIAREEGKSFSELVRGFLDAQLRERKYSEMRLAAENLIDAYSEGGELTEWSALDGDDFLGDSASLDEA